MEMASQPPLSCGQTKRQPFCVPQSASSNFQAQLFLEAWLSTKDQNAGNDHIAIPEVYKPPGSPLSPVIRLKHYVQFVNNFLHVAHACHNFKSRVITISFQTDEGLSISRNVFYQVLKISQCQTLSPLCQLLTTTTQLISECFRVHLLPLV